MHSKTPRFKCATMLLFAIAALAAATLETSDVNINTEHGLHPLDGQPTTNAVALGAAQHLGRRVSKARRE